MVPACIVLLTYWEDTEHILRELDYIYGRLFICAYMFEYVLHRFLQLCNIHLTLNNN